MRISVIGPPGSGKTTQASIIAEKLSLPHVYMGEVLREEVQRGGSLAGQVESALQKGELVDDALVLKLFSERVARTDCKNGFVADGTPRTLYQAQELEKQLPFDKVIFVRTSLAVAKERLIKRGRSDDTETAITRRFGVFSRQTKPVLNLYRRLGKLIEVDGDKTVEEVTEEIMGKLSLVKE